MTTTRITRDAIMAKSRNARGYTVQADTGAFFNVLHVDYLEGVGYAEGIRTGNLVRWVQTGNVRTGKNVVRVRLEFPVDTGDVDGTLEFGTGEKCGGIINRDLARASVAPPSRWM